VERTIALMRGAAPVRAPAGFVDRVVAAARPAPWHRRAARALLVPWPVKLPVTAAAVLLVAGLAVLLYRGVEEQQRAAQAPAAPPALSDRTAGKAARQERAATPRQDAEAPPAPPPVEASRDAAAPERAAAPSEAPPAAARPASPAPERREAGAKAETPLAMSAPVGAPDVVVHLAAPERETAERGLAALAAHLTGSLTARRIAGNDIVVELAIPRDRYADFRREAARFGEYRTESEPSALPDPVRIAVHLGS
jgi:hypothetical protein